MFNKLILSKIIGLQSVDGKKEKKERGRAIALISLQVYIDSESN